MSDPSDISERFLQGLEESRQLVMALVRENTKLRTVNQELTEKITYLQALLAQLPPATPVMPAEGFEKAHRRMRAELEQAHEEMRAIEAENREFADSFVEIEQRNSTLANLYVASYQLHSTLDFAQVVTYVKEIIINLVGSEMFGIYALHDNPRRLSRLSHEGLEDDLYKHLPIAGIVQQALESGSAITADDPMAAKGDLPVAIVPLIVHEHTMGVIAIFKLLHQKADLSGLDREIFDLLAGQAATALYSARLFQQSKRKLDTLEGFLDLLRNK